MAELSRTSRTETSVARRQGLWIACTMLVIFGATFATMYTRQRALEGDPPDAAPQAARIASKDLRRAATVSNAPVPVREAPALETPSTAAGGPSQKGVVPVARPLSPPTLPGDLPLSLQFMHRFVRSETEPPGARPKLVIQAVAYNQTATPLTLEVELSSEADQSMQSARVTVEGGGRAEIGPDQGLEMHPNDWIVLRSPSYNEYRTRVH